LDEQIIRVIADEKKPAGRRVGGERVGGEGRDILEK